MSNDIMDKIRDSFKAEALDLLIELDSALLNLESNPADAALVHRVFRAIHTIKGSEWRCRAGSSFALHPPRGRGL